MSIIQKQITKLIEEASIESLKSGRVLDIDRISRIVQDKMRLLDGGPTLKVRRQGKRANFNLEAHNEMMSEIKFDIDTLYDLIAEKAAVLLNRANTSEVSYKSQRSQLKSIRAAVDDLLFSNKNADDYFFGVFDNFFSLDKVDSEVSNDGVVDLSEGVALLPFSMPSATRVDLSHLYSSVDGRVLSESLNGSRSRGSNGSGTKYGDSFSDVTSYWRYDVISASNSGVKMWATIPLRSDLETTRITRVEVSALANDGISVQLLGSLDDQNYTTFQGAVPKSITADTEKLAWDFPETPVRWVRLVFTKNSPDGFLSSGETNTFTSPVLQEPISSSQDSATPFSNSITGVPQDSWLYSFSINSIAAYKLGRSQDAILQSRPLAPRETPDNPINSISLQVEDEVLPKTSIDYYVALGDSTGNAATEFLPIAPSNRQVYDVPNVVKFGDSTRDVHDFTANTGSINTGDWVSRKAVNHYPVYSGLSDQYEYQFGSSKLYRGGNVFSRTYNSRDVIRSISDNYIDFTDGSRTRQLYSISSETAHIFNRNVGDGSFAKTFLKVDGPIVNSLRTVRESTDPVVSIDSEPDYAIASVDHIRSIMSVTNDPIQPSGIPITVSGVRIPVASSWMGSTVSSASIGVPIIRNGQPIDVLPESVVLKWKDPASSFEYVFREGVDYSIKRSDDSYFDNFVGWSGTPIHWRVVPAEPSTINIQSGSVLTGQYGGTGNFSISIGSLPPTTVGGTALVQDVELSISYEIDSDIIHRVEQVSYSSNEIQLNGLLEIMPGDSIVVKYRKSPSNIVRDTVIVSENPGKDNPGTIYTEGVDYQLDTMNGTLTMSSAGAINALSTPVCYVDFSFKDSIVETQTFSVWCYYDSREPLKFNYNPLRLRTVSGEKLFWSSSDDTKRIDTQTSFTLTRGWHQFTVHSLNPDSFSDAAIWRVLKLRDIENRYLFLRTDKGGSIFSKITAYRSPMRQVTYPFLLNATLKLDHSTFALDTSNRIFIKFAPAQTPELWMYAINSSGTPVLQESEEFTFNGLRKITATPGAENPGYIIFRAHLSRAEDGGGGITPKLHSYNIRIAY